MKKATLILLALFFINAVYCQEKFTWNKVDSVSKSKTEIYSDTKVFITQTWKSAQDVIQLDDKEAGNVIIKGSSIQEVNYSMNVFTYVYDYTVTFRMKDSKYKVTLDNVYCSSAYPVGQAKYDILKIEPFEEEYIKGKSSLSVTTLPAKKAIPMMNSLKRELQDIIDEYIKFIQKDSSFSDDW